MLCAAQLRGIFVVIREEHRGKGGERQRADNGLAAMQKSTGYSVQVRQRNHDLQLDKSLCQHYSDNGHSPWAVAFPTANLTAQNENSSKNTEFLSIAICSGRQHGSASCRLPGGATPCQAKAEGALRPAMIIGDNTQPLLRLCPRMAESRSGRQSGSRPKNRKAGPVPGEASGRQLGAQALRAATG